MVWSNVYVTSGCRKRSTGFDFFDATLADSESRSFPSLWRVPRNQPTRVNGGSLGDGN